MKHENALKTIGEVSSQIKVPVYVIRFWEKKISNIKPIKKKNSARYYSKKQIDLLIKIKHLLYEKKLTIKGALLELNKKDEERENLIKEIESLINEIKTNY